MGGVADAIAAETGRETAVSAVGINFRTVDRVGVIEFAATVDGFATTLGSGERVRVTTPFTDGYTTDRPLVMMPPDGYELTTVTPAPDATSDGRLRWDANRDLNGFEATFTERSVAGAPGFGLLGTVAALALTAALVARFARR